MKVFILISVLTFSHFTTAQLAKNRDFSEVKKAEFESSKYLLSEELLSNINQFDFSNVLITKHHDNVLGYIGMNFRRIDMRYISIIKNPNNSNEYMVYGKSKVSSNIVEFQGTLTLISARKYSEQYFDDKTMGSVLGKYIFYENPNQSHVGTFEGYFTSSWILDIKSNELNYNETGLGADGFKNNSFTGTWTPYGSNKFKTCNWGEYRIPYSQQHQLNSGDKGLDNGAGEFSPADELLKYGWQKYKDDLTNYYNNRTPIETEIWWKD